MYGGGYGGWNPWSGGANTNLPYQQGMPQSQQQMRPGGANQNATGQLNQYQGQLGGNNTMGYAGMGAGSNNNNMAGMMGYPTTAMNNLNNASNLMGMNSNSNQSTLMANANLYAMSGAGLAYGNMGTNQYNQQQQQQMYLQQQQNQNLNQSVYQTQANFQRPQPPLPPGPPPKDQPSRDVSALPLFNNTGQTAVVPPPLPKQQQIPPTPVPPPPLPVKEEENSSGKRNSNNVPPHPSQDFFVDNEPKIPEQVLKLLRNAETARQFQQAAEALAKISPLMKLNVSQDLFGTNNNSKKGGIPGLDFEETNTSPVQEVKSSESKPEIEEKPDRIERISMENVQIEKSGGRKLDQKQPANWNEGRRTWMNPTGAPQGQSQGQGAQIKLKDSSEENNKAEIKWELRPDVVEIAAKELKPAVQNNSSITTKDNSLAPKVPVASPKIDAEKPNENKPPVVVVSNNSKTESIPEQLISDKAVSEQSEDGSDAGGENKDSTGEGGGFSATIPLASKDGKPVEYDRKTLRAFDKKFREWEKQFDNWKMSNDNHPDQVAYKKYMDQWNLWRQQLIEQRRFILDSMNKARLEGNELALQKTFAGDSDSDSNSQTPKKKDEGGVQMNSAGPPDWKVSNAQSELLSSWKGEESHTAQSKSNDNFPTWKGSANNANNTPVEPIAPWKGKPQPNNSITSRLASIAAQPIVPPNMAPKDIRNPNNRNPFDTLSNFQKPQAPPPLPLMSVSVEPIINERFDKGPAASNNNNLRKDQVPVNSRFDSGPQSSNSRFDDDSGQNSRFDKGPGPSNSQRFGPPQQQPPSNLRPDNVPAGAGNSRADRPVERILRDRDRPNFPNRVGTPPKDERNSDKKKNQVMADRVARDPQENQQQNNPFNADRGMVSWELPNPRNNRNPFEIAQEQQQNPFVQASNNNPFAWGSAAPEPKLPTLSDFLKRDEFAVNNNNDQMSHKSMPMMPNSSQMNVFPGSGDSIRGRMDTSVQQRNQQISGPQGITFEPTSKGMPLVTAIKPPQPEPEPEPEQPVPVVKDDISNNLSQWFTRDRRGNFSDAPINDKYEENDYEEDTPTAVIDYGHGTTEPNEEDEFEEYDLPRCERPAVNQQSYNEYYEDDEEQPKDVVTFDYGHGSVPPDMGSERVRRHAPIEDGYYESNDYGHGQYNEEYPPQMHMNQNQGRGFPPPFRGAGRGGRGRFDERSMGHHMGGGPSQQQMRPNDPGYRPPYRAAPSFNPDLIEREPIIGGPVPNRGKGRGNPTRFPGHDESIGPGSQINNNRKPPPPVELDTERVDSPEIIMLDSPPLRGGRKAPPRDSPGDRDRVSRDFSRNDRGRDSSRDRDLDLRRRDRSRENEDRYRSRRDREVEERPRPERNNRVDDRRIRRDPDESPQFRRNRDSERDSRDRYTRPPRKNSQSRSRSPTFDRDRVPVYRNAPGVHPGQNPSSSNPPAPRYQTVLIEDILNQPGRMKRPSQIVIILRGLPGSGKSYVAKLIKDREVEMGGSAPRMLSLDDYFMAETEKVVKDPLTGVEVKETVMEYEYDADLEAKYRNDLVKTFKKNIENGYFQFIIVDGVNDQVRYFDEMVTFATQRRFQVYIAEVEESVDSCVQRNIHNRKKEQIQKIHKNWERTPANFIKLDIRTLLQDEAVQDVEMEDVSDTENLADSNETPTAKVEEFEENWEDDEPLDDPKNRSQKPDPKTPSDPKKPDPKKRSEKPDPDEDESFHFPQTSKWEKLEPSEEKLNRLDGLARKRSGKDDDKVDDSSTASVESWLQSHLPEDYISRQQTKPGQKRVRWADIEERRAQERMRDVGFVVGINWNRMTDPTFGESALTRTKYI